MNKDKKTIDELYDSIISEFDSPEEFAKTILANTIDQYNIIKGIVGEAGVPFFMVAMIAKELGWQISLESREDLQINGISIGTDEYLSNLQK